MGTSCDTCTHKKTNQNNIDLSNLQKSCCIYCGEHYGKNYYIRDSRYDKCSCCNSRSGYENVYYCKNCEIEFLLDCAKNNYTKIKRWCKLCGEPYGQNFYVTLNDRNVSQKCICCNSEIYSNSYYYRCDKCGVNFRLNCINNVEKS